MNKVLFKIHGWAGIIACIPLLVICLTGSVLVFKHEIDSLLMADKVRVDPQPQRLPLDSLVSAVNRGHPDHEMVGWALFQDDARADVVYVMEKGTDEWSYLHLNPYTGTLLSTPRPLNHYLTDWLLELHYTFLLHDPGLLVTSLFAAALLLLAASGLVLHRRFWKNFFTLRWNSRLVLYFSDLHKMVGVVSAPVLLILAFTGIWWNISGYLHEREEHAAGAEHHIMQDRLYSDAISFDALQQEAQARIDGFVATYMSLPWEPGAAITFWGDVPSHNVFASPYSSTVTFSAQSGEWQGSYDIRQAGVGAAIVDSYRRLHYGDFAGLVSRIIWAILGAAPLILAMTGVTLWWKRRRQRTRSRLKRLQALAVN